MKGGVCGASDQGSREVNKVAARLPLMTSWYLSHRRRLVADLMRKQLLRQIEAGLSVAAVQLGSVMVQLQGQEHPSAWIVKDTDGRVYGAGLARSVRTAAQDASEDAARVVVMLEESSRAA